MRLPKLIFAQILVKPGLNGWKAAMPLAPISESPISANLGWKILYSPPRGGGGVLRISSERYDHQRIFLGSNKRERGLISAGTVWGNQNNLKIRDIYGSEIWHEIFGGLNFGPGIFFGFWFLPPFNHPSHLKSGVPLLGIYLPMHCFE